MASHNVNGTIESISRVWQGEERALNGVHPVNKH